MPIVFSPPSVSALKTSVPRYLSGSRAASVEGAVAVLAFAAVRFALAFTFVLTFKFTFDSAGPRAHPLAVSSRARTNINTGGLRFLTRGLASAVFIYGHSPKEIRTRVRQG